MVYEEKEEESLSSVYLSFLLCPLPPPPSDFGVKRQHGDDNNNDPQEIYMIQIYFIFQPVVVVVPILPSLLPFLEVLGRAGGVGGEVRGTDGEGVRFCLSVGQRREDIPIYDYRHL